MTCLTERFTMETIKSDTDLPNPFRVCSASPYDLISCLDGRGILELTGILRAVALITDR